MPTLANVPLSYGVLSVSALSMLTREVGQPMICATTCCCAVTSPLPISVDPTVKW